MVGPCHHPAVLGVALTPWFLGVTSTNSSRSRRSIIGGRNFLWLRRRDLKQNLPQFQKKPDQQESDDQRNADQQKTTTRETLEGDKQACQGREQENGGGKMVALMQRGVRKRHWNDMEKCGRTWWPLWKGESVG